MFFSIPSNPNHLILCESQAGSFGPCVQKCKIIILTSEPDLQSFLKHYIWPTWFQSQQFQQSPFLCLGSAQGGRECVLEAVCSRTIPKPACLLSKFKHIPPKHLFEILPSIQLFAAGVKQQISDPTCADICSWGEGNQISTSLKPETNVRTESSLFEPQFGRMQKQQGWQLKLLFPPSVQESRNYSFFILRFSVFSLMCEVKGGNFLTVNPPFRITWSFHFCIWLTLVQIFLPFCAAWQQRLRKRFSPVYMVEVPSKLGPFWCSKRSTETTSMQRCWMLRC